MANWIKGAIKRPGALKAKAKAAGMSLSKFMSKMGKKDSRASTRTKRQIALARTLRKISKRR